MKTFTKKQLQALYKILNPKETRPMLRNLYVAGGNLTVTDGYVMVAVPIDTDKEGLIDQGFMNQWMFEHSNQATITAEELLEHLDEGYQVVSIKNMIKTDEPSTAEGVDTKLLDKVFKVFQAFGRQYVKLVEQGDRYHIVVEKEGFVDPAERIQAIVMGRNR